MMHGKLAAAAALAAIVMASGCATSGRADGWTTLIERERGLDNFTRVGDANWTAAGGGIHATQGGKDASYLVSKQTYRDFMIRGEFWASDNANSGIFLRCQDPAGPGDETCYEANIFDQRPEPTYGTGAIVKVAKVEPMPKAGGQWNTDEITAQGTRLVLVLNGVKTVDVEDSKLTSGRVACNGARARSSSARSR